MTCDTREREEVIAYYQDVIKDIADVKARFWRFMVALAAITAVLINIDMWKLTLLAKSWLVIGHLSVAASIIFITLDSHIHLNNHRQILDQIYS